MFWEDSGLKADRLVDTGNMTLLAIHEPSGEAEFAVADIDFVRRLFPRLLVLLLQIS